MYPTSHFSPFNCCLTLSVVLSLEKGVTLKICMLRFVISSIIYLVLECQQSFQFQIFLICFFSLKQGGISKEEGGDSSRLTG